MFPSSSRFMYICSFSIMNVSPHIRVPKERRQKLYVARYLTYTRLPN
jgi:hypothetical protein